jgi:hypothetical protein
METKMMMNATKPPSKVSQVRDGRSVGVADDTGLRRALRKWD